MKSRITFILSVLVFLYCAYPALATTWNVPGDSATIQGAINGASYGDTVQVAAETYVENITLKNGVALIGDDALTTTIDGDTSGSVVYSEYCDPNTILQGFTITNGNGIYGGGMYNYNSSSPTVADCTFSDNQGNDSGGGMYNSSSSPTVTHCTFSGNEAFFEGGGMYNNSSNPIITNCTFIGNMTEYSDGGGMFNNHSSPTVTDCTFSGNFAPRGGGIYNFSSSPTVTSCSFSDNQASDSGGGMYNYSSSPSVANCIFTGNTAGTVGGGMYNYDSSIPTVTNCTFTGNTADSEGGAMINDSTSGATVTNCILCGDNPDEVAYNISIPIVTYSDIQGGSGESWFGTGCIDVDPNFVDIFSGNLRLRSGSACIDAGDNTAVPAGVTRDLDGSPRFVDDPATVDAGNGTPPIVDMGAYEFIPPSLRLLAPNGGEILPADSTCTISWQTLLPMSDVVVEYSTAAVPDLFDTKDESNFTLEDSYGSGGNFSIYGGRLHITTGISNTASVMTSETVRFDVGQTLSLDVPAIMDPEEGGDSVFMMCSTTAGQPDPYVIPATFGFVFRRAWGRARIELYPEGSPSDHDDPDYTKPATLKVARVSEIFFVYSITIDGTEHHLGSFILPELAGATNLHIGAQAFDVEASTFDFDDLRVYDSADNGAVWQAVWPPNQGNTGSYDWLVPEALSETCLVRISPADNLAQSDISDGFFSIRGLVAHWKLDETEGFTAVDSAGGNDGSLYGYPQWRPVGGQTGGALQLDGVDDYIDCGNGAALNITDRITLAAWVKTGDCKNGQFNPYITKGDHAFGLKHNDANDIEFMTYIDGWWYTAETPVDSSFNDQWHHLAGTYDGNNLKLYVDGELKATASYAGSINTETASVNIGKNADFTNRFYEGLIDDVRIYNYALSADEIRQLLCIEPIKGDLDNNCRTDLADLALFGDDWMRCGMAFEALCLEQ